MPSPLVPEKVMWIKLRHWMFVFQNAVCALNRTIPPTLARTCTRRKGVAAPQGASLNGPALPIAAVGGRFRRFSSGRPPRSCNRLPPHKTAQQPLHSTSRPISFFGREASVGRHTHTSLPHTSSRVCVWAERRAAWRLTIMPVQSSRRR